MEDEEKRKGRGMETGKVAAKRGGMADGRKKGEGFKGEGRGADNVGADDSEVGRPVPLDEGGKNRGNSGGEDTGTVGRTGGARVDGSEGDGALTECGIWRV